jgi:hypothetical protein
MKQNIENAILKFSNLNIAEETMRGMFPPGLQSSVNFNEKLLQELQKNIDIQNEDTLNNSMLGVIFLERAAFFKIYTDYISGYQKAQRTLMDTIVTNEEFEKLIQQGRSLPDSNGVDLPGLLIMPIQRIPRYVLLLKAILDNTESLHADFVNLSNAVKSMSEIATHVNKKNCRGSEFKKGFGYSARAEI